MQPSAQLDEYKNIMKRLPLVAESLDSRGLYIFDDGFRFVLWFGRMLSPDTAMNLLGSEFAAELSKVRYVFGVYRLFPRISDYYMFKFHLLELSSVWKGYQH